MNKITSLTELKRRILDRLDEIPYHPDSQDAGHRVDVKRMLDEFETIIKDSLNVMMEWTPEHVDLKAISRTYYPLKDFPKKEYGEICTDEDCECPFFCESYLYNLLGKDDARTLLGMFGRLRRLLGEEKIESGRG